MKKINIKRNNHKKNPYWDSQIQPCHDFWEIMENNAR